MLNANNMEKALAVSGKLVAALQNSMPLRLKNVSAPIFSAALAEARELATGHRIHSKLLDEGWYPKTLCSLAMVDPEEMHTCMCNELDLLVAWKMGKQKPFITSVVEQLHQMAAENDI